MPCARRYVPTDEIDAIIKRHYLESKNQNAIQQALSEINRFAIPQWNENVVVRRARDLGLTSPKKRINAWSDAEDAVLADNAHKEVKAIIAALKRRIKPWTNRTPSAVINRLGQLQLRTNVEALNMRQLCEMLGVGKSRVVRWVASGALSAERRPNGDPSQAEYYFGYKPLKKFLLKYSDEYFLHKISPVHQPMFLDIIANG